MVFESEQRPGFYTDLVWDVEPDGRIHLIAEVHQPDGMAERIARLLNEDERQQPPAGQGSGDE